MTAPFSKAKAGRREVRWQIARVQEERRKAGALVLALLEAGAPEEAMARIHSELERRTQDEIDGDALLLRFALILEALDLDARHRLLSRSQSAALREEASAVLDYVGIDAKESRLAYLRVAVARRVAAYHVQDGDALGATVRLWQACAVCPSAPEEDQRDLDLHLARWALRAGHASLALESLATVGEADAELAMLKVEILRIAGDAPGAAAALKEMPPPAEEDRLRREHLQLTLAVADDTAPVERLVRHAAQLDAREHADLVLEAMLWLAASAKRLPRSILPRIETVKRKFRPSGSRAAQRPQLAGRGFDKALMAAVEVIESANDTTLPFEARMERVLALIADRRHLTSIGHEMLVLACAVRFFARHHQTDASRLAFAEYRRLALSLSGGTVLDPLGLFRGEYDDGTRDLAAKDERVPPDGTAARALIVGKMSLGVAATMVKGRLRRAVARKNEHDRLREDQLRLLGEKMLAGLSDLRGLYCKLGQSLSYLDIGVPDPLRQALFPLQAELPPLPKQVVSQMFVAQLGRPPEQLFAEWHAEPFASASIGQVHWARLVDGREVAVKIQIPGIATTLKADLGKLGILRALTRHLLPGTDMDGLVEHLRGMFESELDYAQEGRNLERFARFFEGDPQIVVPRVHADLCSAQILTMDFLRGTSLAAHAADADQESRDRVGAVIYRMAERSFWTLHHYNADPHPGNYVVLEDGRVGFVDFGCVVSFEVQEARNWRGITEALMQGDATRFRAAWLESGLVKDPSADFTELLATMAQMRPHLTTARYRFDQHATQGRLTAQHVHAPFAKALSFPDSSISYVRMSFGIQSVLRLLGAEGDFRAITAAAVAESRDGNR